MSDTYEKLKKQKDEILQKETTTQQRLIESQAKVIERANGLLRKLNSYIDFDEHLDNGDWGIEDASGINGLFDEVRQHLSSLSGGSETP